MHRVPLVAESEPFRWGMFAGLEIEFKQIGIYLIDGRGGIVWRGIVALTGVLASAPWQWCGALAKTGLAGLRCA